MADDRPKKPKPWGALFWGTVTVVAAARALYHPARAIIHDGFVSRCAGVSCDPSMVIEAFEGTQIVYSPMRSVVVAVSATTLYLVPRGEAVLIELTGASGDFTPQVSVGDVVGTGQQVGLARRVSLSVHTIERKADGQARIGSALEPAAWLAAHGITVSCKRHKATELWCEGGRKIVAPNEVARCGIQLPVPSGYALLPISVTTG